MEFVTKRRESGGDEGLTEAWRDYQRGMDYFHGVGLYDRAAECHRMVSGDQWAGLKAGDERPAAMNILAPIVKSMTAMVGQNTLSIHFSPLSLGPARERQAALCEKLDRYAARVWEQIKMDARLWEVLEDACISGDSFSYFYYRDGVMGMDLLDTVNVMLADEQNPDVESQPYLLLIQRRYVDDVRREAKENGVKDLSRILPDEDTELSLGGGAEVKNHQKCVSILKLWKEKGEVRFLKATKYLVYAPARTIAGLRRYPVAHYRWKPVKGGGRGWGDVWDKIPNQISINKNLYRFESSVKASAFPHKVYSRHALTDEDVKRLSYPDSNIGVDDRNFQGVSGLIGYLQPASISPHAKDIWQECITLTRELAGAGDNLENIDPEQASGTAINAAREAKALSLNMQTAACRQFVEDMARIWYALWTAYNPDGLPVLYRADDGTEITETIPADELRAMDVDVRVDVSPKNPFSKLAHEAALLQLFQAGAITFPEYVEALDEDSNVPKDKLMDILEKRRAAEKQQAEQAVAALQAENEALRAQAEQGRAAADKLTELTGYMQSGDYQMEQRMKALDLKKKALEVGGGEEMDWGAMGL